MFYKSDKNKPFKIFYSPVFLSLLYVSFWSFGQKSEENDAIDK